MNVTVSKAPGALTGLLRLYIEERDRGALEAFFEIVYDEYPKIFEGQIRRAGKASDVTVKEVIDESLARLLTDVMEEKYRKAPESARDHLKFMLRRRLIDRRRYWDRPHENVAAYRNAIVDPQMKSPAAEAELRDREAVLDERLEKAFRSMPQRSARMIRLRLEGHTHGEIARKLGIDEGSIRKAYVRAVDQLMARLVEDAPSLVLRLKELRDKASTQPPLPQAESRATASRTTATWPTQTQIRQALAGITERVRDVIDRLHFQNLDRELLEKELGHETLEVLLRRGYDLLEARFKVSFPEAFSFVGLKQAPE